MPRTKYRKHFCLAIYGYITGSTTFTLGCRIAAWWPAYRVLYLHTNNVLCNYYLLLTFSNDLIKLQKQNICVFV